MLVTQCATHAMGEKGLFAFFVVVIPCVAVLEIEYYTIQKGSFNDPVY